MGAEVDLKLLRHGFVPAGGGEIEATVQPSKLSALHVCDRGLPLSQKAFALSAGLASDIARRELDRVARRLNMLPATMNTISLDPECGPGNVLLLEYAFEHVTEVFSAFGQASLRAEAVADVAVNQADAWLRSGAAVAEHLADQLLLPMALAGSGSFTTPGMTEHLQSNVAVIERFLPVTIECREESTDRLRIEVSTRDQ
jgi:RNA 3'-terminal phosphate cyclase (ATP)